jgi:hypothetical protein
MKAGGLNHGSHVFVTLYQNEVFCGEHPKQYYYKIGGNLGSRGKVFFYCIMATQKKRMFMFFLCNQNEMRISVADLY